MTPGKRTPELRPCAQFHVNINGLPVFQLCDPPAVGYPAIRAIVELTERRSPTHADPEL